VLRISLRFSIEFWNCCDSVIIFFHFIIGCGGRRDRDRIWIYNYLCNQCLSPLTLWVRIPFMARCTRNNIMWSSSSVTRDRSVVFSGYSVFPTNKTDRHNITEILLKVALNTIHQPTKPSVGCEKTIMMNQYRLLLITAELKLQSLNNWMLSFFRNQNRSLLHMQNINCKSHWWTDKLTTIKMGIYQVRYACYLYFIFFSIDSSEEMWLEKKTVFNIIC
jgi:hypothetical protein